MAEVNPKISNIAINGNGGPLTAITLTIMASKVEITEDPAYNGGAPQGLQGYYADTQPGSGFPQVGNLQTWLPNNNGQTGRAYQPIIFGGTDGRVHGGEGNYVGAGGTIVVYLQMLTPSAGGILLVEWP